MDSHGAAKMANMMIARIAAIKIIAFPLSARAAGKHVFRTRLWLSRLRLGFQRRLAGACEAPYL